MTKEPRQGPSKWPRCPKDGLPMPPMTIHNRFTVEHRCRATGCKSNFIVELSGKGNS